MPSAQHEGLRDAFQAAPNLSTDIAIARTEHAAGYADFPVPPEVEREEVVANSVPSEWFKSGSGNRAVLFVHGGGFTLGSTATHASLMGGIAKASESHVLGPNYRLAPEHPAPAAVDDVLAVYRWLLEQGFEPEDVSFAGDSAGGGVALSALQALLASDEPMPARAALLSGAYDLTMSSGTWTTMAGQDPLLPIDLMREMFDAYRGDLDADDPRVSPVYGPFEGLPPLLLMVGSTEILLDENLEVAKRARDAGTPVDLEVADGLLHVWPHYAHLIPEGEEGLERAARFLAGESSS